MIKHLEITDAELHQKIKQGEIIVGGYRPCGNCMRSEYKKWKDGFI